MVRPPALLFDLDGTLVDSAHDIAAALSEVRSRRGGGAIGADAVRPLVSLGADELVTRSLGDFAQEPEGDLAEFRAILRSIPAAPEALYPGVRDCLERLRRARHAMAIVTNKPEDLARKLLTELGLDGYFGAVVGGDTLPRRKPDRAPLDHALRQIGGTPADAVMIGDSRVDQLAAAAADIRFLLFEGGYEGSSVIAEGFAAFDLLPGLVASARWRAEGSPCLEPKFC